MHVEVGQSNSQDVRYACRNVCSPNEDLGRIDKEMRLFEALFKGASTRFGLRTIESPFENQEVIFCSFFQNLRLGSIT